MGDRVTVSSLAMEHATILEINPSDYRGVYYIQPDTSKRMRSEHGNLHPVPEPLPPRGNCTLIPATRDQLNIGDRVVIKSLGNRDGIIQDFEDDETHPVIVQPETGREIYTTVLNLLKVVPEVVEILSEDDPTHEAPELEIGDRVLYYFKKEHAPVEGVVLSYDPTQDEPYTLSTKLGILSALPEDIQKISPSDTEDTQEVSHKETHTTQTATPSYVIQSKSIPPPSSTAQGKQGKSTPTPSQAAQSRSVPAALNALRIRSSVPSDPDGSSSESGSDRPGKKGRSNPRKTRSVRSSSESKSSRKAPPPLPANPPDTAKRTPKRSSPKSHQERRSSPAPAAVNLILPSKESKKVLEKRKSLLSDILKQYRDPLMREEAERRLNLLPTEHLQPVFDSIREQQEKFVQGELAVLYGDHANRMLAAYFRKFGHLGHNTFVAFDDCDQGAFGVALELFSKEETHETVDLAHGPANQLNRKEPTIVPGSCRKHLGKLLVSCYPNGDDEADGCMITHCGELVNERVPASSLQLYFNEEVRREDKGILTLSMIIGNEETYELEDLTTQLYPLKKARTGSAGDIPQPAGPYSPDEPLGLVGYLRQLTARLIQVKKGYLRSRYCYEDRDFIQDILHHYQSDVTQRDRSWKPVIDALKRCIDFSWPEACLQILRQLRVSVTAQELVDSYKAHRQASG